MEVALSLERHGMERLDARNGALVVEVRVEDDSEVEEGQLLMILQEDPPEGGN